MFKIIKRKCPSFRKTFYFTSVKLAELDFTLCELSAEDAIPQGQTRSKLGVIISIKAKNSYSLRLNAITNSNLRILHCYE